MFGFRFIKTRPTDYVILFRNGRPRLHGTALNFFYYAPSSSLVIVPAGTRDSNYIFNETTADFQTLSIQGMFTFQVVDPLKLAGLLDFSVDAKGRYTGDGLEKLQVRITNAVQVTLRERLKSMILREALTSAGALVEHTRSRLMENEVVSALGLQVLDFTILQISPTPDMARALEASARENLLKEADEAVYERRNFAVEQERRIKENELQTEIAVEEKNRVIREEQMNAEIAVQEKTRIVEETKMEAVRSIEQKRQEIEKEKLETQIQMEERRQGLVENESRNVIEQARARAEAMRLQMELLKGLSSEHVELLLLSQMDSNKIVARAMRDLARNADRIGTLNISPELLDSLLRKEKKQS